MNAWYVDVSVSTCVIFLGFIKNVVLFRIFFLLDYFLFVKIINWINKYLQHVIWIMLHTNTHQQQSTPFLQQLLFLYFAILVPEWVLTKFKSVFVFQRIISFRFGEKLKKRVRKPRICNIKQSCNQKWWWWNCGYFCYYNHVVMID